MTSNNPFANRIHTAAQQGYIENGRTVYVSQRSSFTTALASEKQVALIESLLSERDLATETRPKFRARLVQLAADHREVAELNSAKASNLITYLFGLPSTRSITASATEVPAGHYAVEQDDTIVFLQVDRPTEGRWAGKVFVKLQHGDEYTNMGREAGSTMLMRIISQGVKECSTRYGRELGRCGVCHRTLTNEESREAGIGPVCRENSGW